MVEYRHDSSRARAEVGPDAALLEAVRAQTRLATEVEIRRLELIVEWCAAHRVGEDEAATYVEFGRDTGLALAGAGAPGVSEFAVLELAAALGMTPEACKRYVGQVLEVHHRLGRLWARVTSGELPFWRAGRIAQHTIALPAAGAAHVDRHLAAVAHRVGVAQTERLCQEALARYAPAEAEAEAKRQAAADAGGWTCTPETRTRPGPWRSARSPTSRTGWTWTPR
jgi:hypothetical protein